MKPETKEILQMVADGVINVEEAERLLDAVSEGERKSRQKGARPGGPGDSFESVRDALAQIGPAVGEAVREVTGIFRDPERDAEFEEGAAPVPPEGTQCTLAPGSRLEIRSERRVGRGGDVELVGTEGETLEVLPGPGSHARLLEKDGRVKIRWRGGWLKVKVPRSVAGLDTKTLGGNVTMSGIDAAAQIKTLGGNLVLSGLSLDCRAKTMGGDVTASLKEDCRGRFQFTTMGGDVDVASPLEGPSLAIEARTMAGRVQIDPGFRGSVRRRSSAGGPTSVQVGEDQPQVTLRLKTMGGNITVRQVRDGD